MLEEEFKLAKGDVSKEADWIMGIAELVEEAVHLDFAAVDAKSKKEREMILKVANLIDKIRIKHLEEFVRRIGDQRYCGAKHNLSAIKRFMEVGDKHRREGNLKKAVEFYKDAYDLLNALVILVRKKELEKPIESKQSSQHQTQPSK